MWSDTPCWEWPGPSFHQQGYGRFAGLYAHRASYEQWHGPIPPGLVVMHLCDNPPCMNPLHLRAGTQQENMHMSPTMQRNMNIGRQKAWASLDDRINKEARQRKLAKGCSVDECDGVHAAKGLCKKHYKRHRRGTL